MKNKKSNFRGKVSADVQKQGKDAKSYGYLNLPKDTHVFTVTAGDKVQLDFLPYEVTDARHPDRDQSLDIAMPGTLWYKRPFKVHRNVGADNDTVVCPTSFGKKCPICEYGTKRFKEGAEKEELNALRASQRNLYIVVPKGHKKFEETPHIYDISQFLFQNLLNEELNENPDNEVFPDLAEGKTLKIRYEEKTIGKNKFLEASRIDFMDRDEAYDEDILEKVPNLDEVLKVLSYDELQLKFFEMDNEPDAGAIETTPVVRERKTAKPVEDDDDDVPVSTRERKTVKEAPAAKSKAKSPKVTDIYSTVEDMSWDIISIQPQSGLLDIVKHFDLDIEVDDYEDDLTAFRKIVAKELGVKIPLSEKPKPAPKPVKEDDDDDDAVVEKTPTVSRNKPIEKVPATGKNKCPFGKRFGVDNSKHDCCDDCNVWDDCAEA